VLPNQIRSHRIFFIAEYTKCEETHVVQNVSSLRYQRGILTREKVFPASLLQEDILPKVSDNREKGKHRMSEAKNNLQKQILALQPQIGARAVKDEVFRQHLLKDPKQTLKREFGVIVPHGVTIQIHEETPTTLHLVLPMKPLTGELQELSDEELKEVAGGDAIFGSSNHPHTWSQQDQINTN
jgi:hypothetical protein